MIYSSFGNKELSKLGFGAMRLPLLADATTIDEKQVADMVDYAMQNGINYFDTAYPYHGGLSEVVLGKALKKYPRDTYYLANKYPGHQHTDHYDPAAIFNHQLKKCDVEYFDFYLMHNVCENSIDVYLDPQWGMLDYFLQQKKEGRIHHLGFSSHADLPTLKRFLDSEWGSHMEFCQIQLNHLDWTLQKAKEKCELLSERNIPIWVMEPLRGGKLAEEGVGPAFRWLQGIEGVKVILSGMSNLQQMKDNISVFESFKTLTEEDKQHLKRVEESLLNNIPCTACRYCCDGCPQGFDIPMLIRTLNDMRVQPSFTTTMYIESLPDELQPKSCLDCGACKEICPQGIDVPSAMKELTERYEATPKWADICRQRNEEARRLAGD